MMVLLSDEPYYVKLILSVRNTYILSFLSMTSINLIDRTIETNENEEFIINSEIYVELIPLLIKSEVFDYKKIKNHYVFKLNDFGKLKLL